jgi:hypothetical protein
VSELPDHVRRNRAYWDEKAAYATVGRRAWPQEEIWKMSLT